MISISDCNPYLRMAMIQPSVLEGCEPRIAYDYRAFFILEGNGKIFIENEFQELRENTLVCFPPGEEYYFIGKMKVIVFNFDMTRTCSHRTEAQMPLPKKRYHKNQVFDSTLVNGFESPVLCLADKKIKEQILAITNCFIANGNCRDAQCSALLKALLVGILLREDNTKDQKTLLAERLLFYIQANAAEIKNNVELGETFGYHPIYLSSVFKKQTGKSLHQAILEEKMKLACKWLIQTNDSIEEIAYDTGFSSRNHFCTVFKKQFGISPLTYRSQRKVI